MDHIGSLPIIFGRLGLGGVPVICTTPVSKFGKMILYDFCLNKEMEGSQINNGNKQQQFELDDIDLALSNVTTVKYSQTIHLPGVSESVGEWSKSGHLHLDKLHVDQQTVEQFRFPHKLHFEHMAIEETMSLLPLLLA